MSSLLSVDERADFMHHQPTMQVFVAGATGVLGKRVVKKLLADRHRVVCLARSEPSQARIRDLGAEALRADIFHPAEVEEASSGSDAILHLATAIPTSARTSRSDWVPNDRLRREGTRTLLDAALRVGARLYLQESITFLYGDRGGEWVDEASPIAARLAPVLESAKDMEVLVRSAAVPAVILRFGAFYSEDAAHTRRILEMARTNSSVVIADGKNFTNPIHVDDAAAAVCLAVERGERLAGETFNICDDEPVTARALADFVSEELGARRATSLPRLLAKTVLGPHLIDAATASVRCRNGKARDGLGLAPRYPTFREGYRAVVERWRESLSSGS
jgi:nucleoside-diphosphate-sugar epimerase